MSEPELPGIPAPKPPKVPPWYKRLLTRRKLPGWAFFALLVIQQIPDWKARLDFWLSAAREARGYAGVAATVIQSSYFSIGLAMAGVLWLAFVGEPQRGVQRHHWLPYFGWALVGVCATAIVITAGWGEIHIYIEREAAKISGPGWHLSLSEHEQLSKLLKYVPENGRYQVRINVLLASTQSQSMGMELRDIPSSAGWPTPAISADQRLLPDITGINIEFAPDLAGRSDKDFPFHGDNFADLMKNAGIGAKFGAYWGFDNNSLVLAIGSRPPPGAL